MTHNKTSHNIYDIVFVLPQPTISYPPGGYDVVYRLAQGLNKEKIRTAIIFLKKPEIYIENYIVTEKLKKKNILYSLTASLFNLCFNGKKISFFYDLHLYKLLRIDYDYSILDNVDLYFYETIENVRIKTNVIIATAWQTAYFVREYIKVHTNKSFYFIQNSEDDFSFSGENSGNAKLTYRFPFKKIVINKKIFQRFILDEPLFFHVGIDSQFFKRIIEPKDRECIMFPLRNNVSKGAKYVIECIRKLLEDTKDAKIIAYGDYKEENIPSDIKDRITYYYRPSRKVLVDLYNHSMVFVLPSIVEGMPLPPLEAMACGCAVVVTDNGGINEYINDGINGIICPIRDSNCLYEKIMLLINDITLRQKLIQYGLETAQKFSYDNMNKNFVQLIKKDL